MRFDVRHNIRDVERGLSDFARGQLPFATSRALNAVADDVARAEEAELRDALDRPTPFTLKGVAVRRSSKARLEAAVFIKDRQAAYLTFQEQGGTRRPAGRAIPVPATTRRNKFGNLSKGAVKKLAAAPNTFSGTPKGGGPAGLYRRLGARANRRAGYKLQLMVTWAGRATYKPRLAFIETAQRVARRRIAAAVERELAAAIATARR